ISVSAEEGLRGAWDSAARSCRRFEEFNRFRAETAPPRAARATAERGCGRGLRLPARDDNKRRKRGVPPPVFAHAKPYLTSSSSTSKKRVAFGGMTPPAPREPYPSSGGISRLRFPPTFMLATPSSQPLMTRPCPIGKEKGVPRSRELSNFFPFAPFSQSQPV